MSCTPRITRKNVPGSGTWPCSRKRLSTTESRPDMARLGRSKAPLRSTYEPNESLYDRDPTYLHDRSSEDDQENFGPGYRARSSAESGNEPLPMS